MFVPGSTNFSVRGTQALFFFLFFCLFGTQMQMGGLSVYGSGGSDMYRYKKRDVCMWMMIKAWRLDALCLGRMG
jgi:hypothetical protein